MKVDTRKVKLDSLSFKIKGYDFEISHVRSLVLFHEAKVRCLRNRLEHLKADLESVQVEKRGRFL